MTLFHGLGPISSSLASGELQFITSASASSASTVNIDNCFSAAYDHYLILRDVSGSGADNALNVRLRASGSDSATGYRYQVIQATSTSVPGARDTAATSFASLLGYTEATSCGYVGAWISNPFGAVRTTAWTNHSGDVDGNIYLQSIVYEHDTASSYDGFSVLTSAGQITGTIYVYGLKV